MKKVKMSLSITILLVTLAIGCAFCFVSLQNAKKEFADFSGLIVSDAARRVFKLKIS